MDAYASLKMIFHHGIIYLSSNLLIYLKIEHTTAYFSDQAMYCQSIPPKKKHLSIPTGFPFEFSSRVVCSGCTFFADSLLSCRI